MPNIDARAVRVPSEPNSYQPPSFLVSRTLLPIEELVRQYEVFKNATQYISAAPELVFERLISSIAEAYTTRHDIGRIQELGTDVEAVNTITTSLERISTSIEALRDAIAAQEHQGTITATHAAAQFQALLAEVRRSLPGRRPNDTIAPQLTLPQAEQNMRITMNFTPAVTNTGIVMAIEDTAAGCSYATNPPWADILDEYPQAQWGSETRPIASAFHVNEQITFPQAFRKLPSVRCWLTGFETTDLPLRARVRTSQITETGFLLHVEPPTLRSAGITWLAGLPLNQVGQFDANASGMWAGALPLATGFTVTGQRTYTRLAVAVTQVDIAGSPAFPVKLEPLLARGCDYFTWTLSAGVGDKGLYLIKGAFMMV